MSFWNRVKSGASKAANEATKQATIARINMQMGDVKTELRRKIDDLGEAALVLCRSGELTQPSLTVIYGEITTIEGRIKDLESQIAAARGDDEPTSAASS